MHIKNYKHLIYYITCCKFYMTLAFLDFFLGKPYFYILTIGATAVRQYQYNVIYFELFPSCDYEYFVLICVCVRVMSVYVFGKGFI